MLPHGSVVLLHYFLLSEMDTRRRRQRFVQRLLNKHSVSGEGRGRAFWNVASAISLRVTSERKKKASNGSRLIHCYTL
jgi:hypothetical protein